MQCGQSNRLARIVSSVKLPWHRGQWAMGVDTDGKNIRATPVLYPDTNLSSSGTRIFDAIRRLHSEPGQMSVRRFFARWGRLTTVGRDQKIGGTPHEPRRGWLKNGNPPGYLSRVRRCGAKNRQGRPCQCPSMANGRCRLHGGLSTGPKTLVGIERIRRAVTKHGRYSHAAMAEQRYFRSVLRECKQTLSTIR